MTARGRRPLAGAALTVVLGVSACGFGADDRGAAVGDRTVPSRAAAEPTRPAMPAVGDTVRATDLARRTAAALQQAGTVRITVTSAGRTLAGELDVRGATPAYRLAGGTGQDAVEVRYVDGVLYLGGEQLAEAGGRAFVRVDPDGEDLLSRMLAPLLTTLAQATDPSALLAHFGSAGATVSKVAAGRVTYTLEVSAAQLERATEKLLGGPLPAQAAKRLRPLTFEQTLDADGRLVRARQVGGADGDTEVVYQEYGADLRVTAPPAGQVGTAPD